MELQFGWWDHFERRRDVSVLQQFQQRVELVQLAESFGFYGYHVAEHHLTPLDVAGSPIVYLSALAQHTARIRLGTMVLVLPLYHPVRLLQDICLLDNLSGGRFMPGVGRGVRDIEHDWFGVDPFEARARFSETLEILAEGMTTGKLTHQGRFYQFDNVPVDQEPTQKPYPPFWYAGGLDTAAKLGMNVIGFSQLARAQVDGYWELWRESRAQPNPLNPQVSEPKVGSFRHLIIADTDEQARAIARRAWNAYGVNFRATLLKNEGRIPPAEVLPGGEIEADFDAGRLVAGSPATVQRRLSAYLDALGPGFNYLVNAFQWGDINHAEAQRSLTLFATEVMPALKQTAPAGV